MSKLPKPMSGKEIDEAADAAYVEALDDPRFHKFLNANMVSDTAAMKIFRLGFMAGGEAATTRIQEYVNAGGVLERG